jgi:ribosomal protein L17
MPLGRTLKQYKHFMRTLVSQLIIHENIQTTFAKVFFKLCRQKD